MRFYRANWGEGWRALSVRLLAYARGSVREQYDALNERLLEEVWEPLGYALPALCLFERLDSCGGNPYRER